ncbi:hypothetical protein D9757_005219 [Collybiopsis confluens]|uniref:Eukaryotic translation initiation factor 5B n=1 Tax=Collybiopsis confluens TaxID=2823264 RepID=A0A8H5MDW5_9AGAR|nr:hypothetical protein D9757_005219 [Collybiopsis confluens]
MAPKSKAKKGKKVDDDDFWDKAGESVANNKLENVSDNEDDGPIKPKVKSSGFSAFAELQMDDGGAEQQDVEEEQDFGGLMSAIKASTNKPKKDKKKAKKDLPPADASDEETNLASASKQAVAVTADDFDDDEWGPSKDKGKKKGKKAKGKKSKAAEADEEEEEPKPQEDSKPSEPELAPAPAPPNDAAADTAEAEADGDEDADGQVKILSKKEKEKLKKEREKAKKKAQAAAKKSARSGGNPDSSKGGENDGEVEEEEPTGKSDSKNKKKKKKVKKDDEPPPPPPATMTKKKGGISALKAMMEEKKRLEEEARRAEEEERKRIEEEERKAEEEAQKKEAEKQRKKEKEKAKKELAKKEGRLLTKKQKEEKAAAEMRKQALLASGVQIEGLQQQSGSGGGQPKKVVYNNRKKKGPAAAGANGVSPASSRPRTPEPPAIPEEQVAPSPAKETAEEPAKDDWDASSGEEESNKAASEGVKDSWDASSDEGEETKSAKTSEAKPAPKSQKESPSKAVPTTATPANPAEPQEKPSQSKPKSVESESEEESDDDDDDGSSEEDSSEEDSDSDSESSDDELSTTQKLAAQRKAEAAARRAKTHEAALAAGSKDNLRSPICCILGHVDTGKTKLLDKIRQTNVQEGEAGGITQQIGATYFPVEAIVTKTAVMNKDGLQEYKIPGLLVIDTPGHESFTNLRSRGSSLCNIAILVVDIMHGLEAQTLESLRLLRDRKTPFIVALNKIDRLYGWEATPDGAFRESLAKQTRAVQREFEDRVSKTIVAFAEEGLNAILYYDNKNFARNVSLVPTSAVTGEGVPDMIMLLVNLTQQRMSDRLMYLSELECTVLEVKVIEGLGTTIDVVLSNGILREGDKIVICGLNGPIVTQVRALLTPQPLRELRIKSAYVHHKEVKAALGVKITAPDLEKAIAGSRLLVCGPDDEEDDLKEEVMSDLATLLSSIDKSGRGVCVQASTLGSLEALLEFLKSSKIPVSGINIGPVHKKDVMRAATMLEKARELACILCFDVPVDKDAERMAEEMGIRVFKADIIYHLFDKFTAYNQEITEAKRRDAAPQAIWPCRLKIIAAFAKRDPIILGVDILDGTLRVGTPLAVVKVDPTTQKKEIIDLGKVTSLEINHKSMEIVKKSQAGGGVAVKIEHAVYQSAKMFGRHFDEKDELMSHITRLSIDVLKSSFRTDVSTEEWMLIKALKPVRILFSKCPLQHRLNRIIVRKILSSLLSICVHVIEKNFLIESSFASRFHPSTPASTFLNMSTHSKGSEEAVTEADVDETQLGSPSVIVIYCAPFQELGTDLTDVFLEKFRIQTGLFSYRKHQLHRSWHLIESFAASFCALNFIGGVRSAIFLGLLAGGPAAIWSSYVITIIFMMITAAVLAEICSALPLSGSIYIWAAESAGPKYARFFGFIVAWWSCTAWMTFTASNSQATANYVVSQLAVWEIDFPGGVSNDNVKWRALIWAVSEALLFLSAMINYLPPKYYSGVFKFSVGLMMLDFFLCLIWLPIGVSKTYGFRDAKEVFTMTYNGTGAPAGWNWLLSFLFTAGTMTGFDASGHIAEETKNASVVAGKGILTSALATGVLGFITTILFLFCTPDLDTLFALDAPQPFVQLYALALGKGPSIFMTVIAVIGLMLNTSVAIVAASRLVFAVARDGVLPMSGWIGQVTDKGQPKNAVTVLYIFSAIILCTIYLARSLLPPWYRLQVYPPSPRHDFAFFFPVDADSLNFACVIFGTVTIFGILSWYFTPEEKWLPREQILRALHSANGDE